MLESVQSILFGWKVLQPSIAALYWTISEASKFLQVSCFQGISGQEFCLPWQFKKRPQAGKQGMFCWMQFCRAGGVFHSLRIKSWPTYFAVKSDTQQQTFVKATYILREGNFTIFSQTITLYFLELVTYYCYICVWRCTKQRGKRTRRWQDRGRGGDAQLKNLKLAFE